MSDSRKDELDDHEMVVHDKAGRRQFIQRGAAFVAAGGAAVGGLVATSKPVYADDCDRNQTEGKNAEAPGSDSDTGASADPTGCGRREPPKISSNDGSIDPVTPKPVKTIKA